MAAGVYYKHEVFLENLAHGVHDLADNTSCEATSYLTNTIPLVTNSVLADLTSVVTTNLDSQIFGAFTTAGHTAGQYRWKLPTLVLTASGAVADFQYIGIYDDAPTSPADPLICWWDYASTVSMVNTDTFTISFAGNTFTLGA